MSLCKAPAATYKSMGGCATSHKLWINMSCSFKMHQALLCITWISLCRYHSVFCNDLSKSKHSFASNGSLDTFGVELLKNFPNPQKDINKCGHLGRISYFCDPYSILTHSQALSVERAINDTCSQTECECSACSSPWYQVQTSGCEGYKVAVAITRQVDNGQSTNGAEESLAKEGTRWAHYLRQTSWKIGTCGDDVIILLVTNTKQVYTSVGDKAGETVTKECVNKSHREVSGLLEQARYEEALRKLITNYRNLILKNDKVECTSDEDSALQPTAIVVITLFSAFTLVIIISAICCVFRTCKDHVKSSSRQTNEDQYTNKTNTSRTIHKYDCQPDAHDPHNAENTMMQRARNGSYVDDYERESMLMKVRQGRAQSQSHMMHAPHHTSYAPQQGANRSRYEYEGIESNNDDIWRAQHGARDVRDVR